MQELSRRGIRLLEDETIESIFDSEKGTVHGIEMLQQGFLLTSKRLVYVEHEYLASWLSKTRSRAALLQDVSYLETRHHTKALALLAIMVLVLSSGMFLAISAGQGDWQVGLWGASAIVIIGTILGCVLLGTPGTTISTQIGGHTCKVKYDKSAEEDAVEFATIFFARKSGM